MSHPTHIYRTCDHCGVRYEIDQQEIADGAYSPLCTDCLRQECERNDPRSLVAELLLGENN